MYPDSFPNQGGVPVKVDGQTIGAIACSGAASDVDEAISLAAVGRPVEAVSYGELPRATGFAAPR